MGKALHLAILLQPADKVPRTAVLRLLPKEDHLSLLLVRRPLLVKDHRLGFLLVLVPRISPLESLLQATQAVLPLQEDRTNHPVVPQLLVAKNNRRVRLLLRRTLADKIVLARHNLAVRAVLAHHQPAPVNRNLAVRVSPQAMSPVRQLLADKAQPLTVGQPQRPLAARLPVPLVMGQLPRSLAIIQPHRLPSLRCRSLRQHHLLLSAPLTSLLADPSTERSATMAMGRPITTSATSHRPEETSSTQLTSNCAVESLSLTQVCPSTFQAVNSALLVYLETSLRSRPSDSSLNQVSSHVRLCATSQLVVSPSLSRIRQALALCTVP